MLILHKICVCLSKRSYPPQDLNRACVLPLMLRDLTLFERKSSIRTEDDRRLHVRALKIYSR